MQIPSFPLFFLEYRSTSRSFYGRSESVYMTSPLPVTALNSNRVFSSRCMECDETIWSREAHAIHERYQQSTIHSLLSWMVGVRSVAKI